MELAIYDTEYIECRHRNFDTWIIECRNRYGLSILDIELRGRNMDGIWIPYLRVGINIMLGGETKAQHVVAWPPTDSRPPKVFVHTAD